jgi:hypothetical protein
MMQGACRSLSLKQCSNMITFASKSGNATQCNRTSELAVIPSGVSFENDKYDADTHTAELKTFNH